MIESLYKTILCFHIVSGATALISGLVVMAAPKAGTVHRKTGGLYFWSMTLVFITTLMMLALKPTKENLWFLGAVGMVSYYQTFTGRFRVKKNFKTYTAGKWDWATLALALTTGIACLVAAGFYGWQTDYFRMALFGFFASIALVTAKEDFALLRGNLPNEQKNWLPYHIGRMMGSYAATVTAFVVNAVPGFLPNETPMFVFLSLWIIPGVLVGTLGSRWQKKQRILQPGRIWTNPN
jgi:hypothetical protein